MTSPIADSAYLQPIEVFLKISKTVEYCLDLLSKEGQYAKEGFTAGKVELLFNEKYQARGFHVLYSNGGKPALHQFLFSVSMSNNRLNIQYSDEIWRCLYEIGAKGNDLEFF